MNCPQVSFITALLNFRPWTTISDSTCVSSITSRVSWNQLIVVITTWRLTVHVRRSFLKRFIQKYYQNTVLQKMSKLMDFFYRQFVLIRLHGGKTRNQFSPTTKEFQWCQPAQQTVLVAALSKHLPLASSPNFNWLAPFKRMKTRLGKLHCIYQPVNISTLARSSVTSRFWLRVSWFSANLPEWTSWNFWIVMINVWFGHITFPSGQVKIEATRPDGQVEFQY